jgi:hypothetical protein
MPAKNILATTFTNANPPLTYPKRMLQKLMSLLLIPPAFIRFPAKMKKGTARRGKESVPENISLGIRRRGMLPE